MNLWGTLTTVVLVFVIYCFLSAIYHYLRRYARSHGYGAFTEGFRGYNGDAAQRLGRSARWVSSDTTHDAYALGQASPLVTNCNYDAAGLNHSTRCGNNVI